MAVYITASDHDRDICLGKHNSNALYSACSTKFALACSLPSKYRGPPPRGNIKPPLLERDFENNFSRYRTPSYSIIQSCAEWHRYHPQLHSSWTLSPHYIHEWRIREMVVPSAWLDFL